MHSRKFKRSVCWRILTLDIPKPSSTGWKQRTSRYTIGDLVPYRKSKNSRIKTISSVNLSGRTESWKRRIVWLCLAQTSAFLFKQRFLMVHGWAASLTFFRTADHFISSCGPKPNQTPSIELTCPSVQLKGTGKETSFHSSNHKPTYLSRLIFASTTVAYFFVYIIYFNCVCKHKYFISIDGVPG